MTKPMAEPTPGNYTRHEATDDYGRPCDPPRVDVRWCKPDGTLTWLFGVHAEFLDALEAKAAALDDALARIEAMQPFQSGWEEPDVTIVELQQKLDDAKAALRDIRDCDLTKPPSPWRIATDAIAKAEAAQRHAQ